METRKQILWLEREHRHLSWDQSPSVNSDTMYTATAFARRNRQKSYTLKKLFRRQIKSLLRTLTGPHFAERCAFSRKTGRRQLTEFRTGDCKLRKHLTTLGREIDHRCRFCEEIVSSRSSRNELRRIRTKKNQMRER